MRVELTLILLGGGEVTITTTETCYDVFCREFVDPNVTDPLISISADNYECTYNFRRDCVIGWKA